MLLKIRNKIILRMKKVIPLNKPIQHLTDNTVDVKNPMGKYDVNLMMTRINNTKTATTSSGVKNSRVAALDDAESKEDLADDIVSEDSVCTYYEVDENNAITKHTYNDTITKSSGKLSGKSSGKNIVVPHNDNKAKAEVEAEVGDEKTDDVELTNRNGGRRTRRESKVLNKFAKRLMGLHVEVSSADVTNTDANVSSKAEDEDTVVSKRVKSKRNRSRTESNSNIKSIISLAKIPRLFVRICILLIVILYLGRIISLFFVPTLIPKLDLFFLLVNFIIEFGRYILCYSDLSLRPYNTEYCSSRTILLYTKKSDTKGVIAWLLKSYMSLSDVARIFIYRFYYKYDQCMPLSCEYAVYIIIIPLFVTRFLSIIVAYAMENVDQIYDEHDWQAKIYELESEA